MFAHLRGTIHSKEMTAGQHDRVVLDVCGVGYELLVSRRTLLLLGEPGEEAFITTALCVKENDWTLFGFAGVHERQMFGLLQSVTGIGPKLALSLLGTLEVHELAQAILSQNEKLISQAPGVGSKVAQRIILELQSKIEDWRQQVNVPAASVDRSVAAQSTQEVRAILEGLGYTGAEINMALRKAGDDNVEDDVETLVRYSLRVLGATAVSQ